MQFPLLFWPNEIMQIVAHCARKEIVDSKIMEMKMEIVQVRNFSFSTSRKVYLFTLGKALVFLHGRRDT